MVVVVKLDGVRWGVMMVWIRERGRSERSILSDSRLACDTRSKFPPLARKDDGDETGERTYRSR